MPWMDRWAARLQRKSDGQQARWLEMERLRPLVPSGPVKGPDGSTALVSVEQTGRWWLHWWTRPVPSAGGNGGLLIVALLVCELGTQAIWRLVFHRAYTVHVHTKGHSPIKIHVRLPNQAAAYRAAAQFVIDFQAGGLAALQGRSADAPG